MLGLRTRFAGAIALLATTMGACSGGGTSALHAGATSLDKWATAFCTGQLQMSAGVGDRYGPVLHRKVVTSAEATQNRRALLVLDAAILRADDAVSRATRSAGAPKIVNGRSIHAVTLRMIGNNRHFFEADARRVAALPTSSASEYEAARRALPHNWSDWTGHDAQEQYRLDASGAMAEAFRTLPPCVQLTGAD